LSHALHAAHGKDKEIVPRQIRRRRSRAADPDLADQLSMRVAGEGILNRITRVLNRIHKGIKWYLRLVRACGAVKRD